LLRRGWQSRAETEDVEIGHSSQDFPDTFTAVLATRVPKGAVRVLSAERNRRRQNRRHTRIEAAVWECTICTLMCTRQRRARHRAHTIGPTLEGARPGSELACPSAGDVIRPEAGHHPASIVPLRTPRVPAGPKESLPRPRRGGAGCAARTNNRVDVPNKARLLSKESTLVQGHYSNPRVLSENGRFGRASRLTPASVSGVLSGHNRRRESACQAGREARGWP
jgi:hypothetical protein